MSGLTGDVIKKLLPEANDTDLMFCNISNTYVRNECIIHAKTTEMNVLSMQRRLKSKIPVVCSL